LISDTNGNLLYESPSSNPPLGYATGEFLGKSLMKLVHPDDVEHVQGRLAELIHDPGLHPREQFPPQASGRALGLGGGSWFKHA